MCDVAYARLVAQIEAEVHAQQIAVAFGGGDWPTVDDRVALFDAALCAEPKLLRQDELELRRALGLR